MEAVSKAHLGIRASWRRRIGLLIIVTLFGVATTIVAGTEGRESHAPARKPSAEEVAALKAAEPVFAKHCYRCHTRAGKKAKRKTLDHLDMDRYPFGGHHADEAASAIRKTLGVTGKKATMPKDDPGAVSGDALAKILAWADAFDRAGGGGTAESPASEHDLGHSHPK